MLELKLMEKVNPFKKKRNQKDFRKENEKESAESPEIVCIHPGFIRT
jgi:hypothetical protein